MAVELVARRGEPTSGPCPRRITLSTSRSWCRHRDDRRRARTRVLTTHGIRDGARRRVLAPRSPDGGSPHAPRGAGTDHRACGAQLSVPHEASVRDAPPPLGDTGARPIAAVSRADVRPPSGPAWARCAVALSARDTREGQRGLVSRHRRMETPRRLQPECRSARDISRSRLRDPPRGGAAACCPGTTGRPHP